MHFGGRKGDAGEGVGVVGESSRGGRILESVLTRHFWANKPGLFATLLKEQELKPQTNPCEFGQAAETIEHFLFRCKTWIFESESMIKDNAWGFHRAASCR
ncbi:hypothetical protein O988_08651 [Pseudogymnoascus sp. VKM F-3808]|nr:hypothetical protein O988_08651 [Pseudogymnoascus sp. VKM F-3808]